LIIHIQIKRNASKRQYIEIYTKASQHLNDVCFFSNNVECHWTALSRENYRTGIVRKKQIYIYLKKKRTKKKYLHSKLKRDKRPFQHLVQVLRAMDEIHKKQVYKYKYIYTYFFRWIFSPGIRINVTTSNSNSNKLFRTIFRTIFLIK